MSGGTGPVKKVIFKFRLESLTHNVAFDAKKAALKLNYMLCYEHHTCSHGLTLHSVVPHC
jgi:hypothetical protein